MLAAERIVKVRMLHQHLPDAVFGANELSVGVHQDGLTLRGIVHLVLLGHAGQLVAGALEIIQASDFGRAAGDQDHTRPEVAAQALKDIVVNGVFLLLNQRHAADFDHQFQPLHAASFPSISPAAAP